MTTYTPTFTTLTTPSTFSKTRSDIEFAIREEIDNHVDAGQMFTALDISRAVQNNHGVNAPHTSLKETVHAYYVNKKMGYNYTRTQITVPGGKAFLYHNENSDPQNYDPTKVQPLPANASIDNRNIGTLGLSNTPTDNSSNNIPGISKSITAAIGNPFGDNHITQAPPVSTPAPVVNFATVACGKATTLQDGRLRIPVKASEQAGFVKGQQVYLSVEEDGSVEIFEEAPKNRKTRKVTVDTYRNILFMVDVNKPKVPYEVFAVQGFIKATPV